MPRTRTPKPDLIDKERQVVELRRAGHTWEAIAEAVGYSEPSGAHAAFRRAMKRTLIEAGTEEIRQLELDRLDKLQTKVWEKIDAGDINAVHIALKILDRRAKYLGLDAPIRQDIKVDVADAHSIDAEVARLVALLDDATPVKE